MFSLNKGTILVVLGTILFSSKAIMVKYLYQLGIGSLELQTLRMLFVLPFYTAILLWSLKKSGWGTLSAKELLGCILAGIACYHIASYLDLLGLQYITAGLERIILFCYPAIAILFSWLFLKEKPMPRLWIALLMSYAGIVVFFYADLSFAGDEIYWGSFLVFVASIFTAWYMVANQRYSRQIGSQRFVCLAMISACITLLIHSAIVGVEDLTQYTSSHYAGVAVIAIFMTLIPSFMISVGVKLIGASKAGIVGTVGPLFTIILSNQLLGEPVSWLHLLGLLLVLFGMRQLKV
ncbi:DMT family transporter [Aliiglaciecola sp. LCG003]|uniref:DMT family transporter n=1 Tax=Aliiglaciecola sp. LCG003 TaxID=3053655 RepID=UPI002574318F|nr:DMT family transporter [Aliiglaciecola sp. LCG003]WJG08695.1 DMT family transporter [Aliiglaciecola sp. LCG003]